MNLYTFTTDTGVEKWFTTAKANVVLEGVTYEANSMRRSSYTLDSIDSRNSITIMFPGDDVFARDFIHPTTVTLQVKIATLNGVTFYRGKLVTASYNPNNTINLTFEPPIRLGLKVSGERRMFQLNCPYKLYGDNCQARRVKHLLRVSEVVSSTKVKVSFDTGRPSNATRKNSLVAIPTIGGNRVDIGRFVGGIIEKNSMEWWITDISDAEVNGSVVGFVVTVFSSLEGVAVNDELLGSLGCRRSPEDCVTVHNNIANYGGFPGMIRPSVFDSAGGN